MALAQVEAKTTKGTRAGQVFTVNYDIPETLDEAKERFGEEVVYSNFRQSMTISLQSVMRGAIQADNATPESVQEAADKWQPGVKRQGKSKAEKISDLFADLSDEERQELLSQLSG